MKCSHLHTPSNFQLFLNHVCQSSRIHCLPILALTILVEMSTDHLELLPR